MHIIQPFLIRRNDTEMDPAPEQHSPVANSTVRKLPHSGHIELLPPLHAGSSTARHTAALPGIVGVARAQRQQGRKGRSPAC